EPTILCSRLDLFQTGTIGTPRLAAQIQAASCGLAWCAKRSPTPIENFDRSIARDFRITKTTGRCMTSGSKLNVELPKTHMPTATEIAHGFTLPLTVLSDEEKMFQNTVRRFARERIGPFVREMDEAGVFRKELLQEMFELGLMGIEIPEEYGGQGGNFFQSVLAVEALAAVDPSAAVIVDVQNTIANNVIIRWGNEEQKRRYLPKLASDTVASLALSEAGSGSDAFA